MTGNTLKNTGQSKSVSRTAADKLVATRKLNLSESQHANVSPKNNWLPRYETKFGTSFK